MDMYARCINTKNVDLTISKEYKIIEVKSIEGFGDKTFYILEDGLAYASIHFSVTYTK